MNRENRIKKILAHLAEQKHENQVDYVVNRVLSELVRSDFGIELTGTMADESGRLFGYMICKMAIIEKIEGGPTTGIFVTRLTDTDAVALSHSRHYLKKLKVFNEEEKELALDNIELSLGI